MKLEQAARQALEALEALNDEGGLRYTEDQAITALREALAEQEEQEPVAWCELTKAGEIAYFDGKPIIMPGKIGNYCHPTPLYAAPARTKDLTDDEIHDVFKSLGFSLADPRTEDFSVARAVIAADREKNK